MRVVVAVVLVAAFAAGCDDNGQKYSRSDVKQAFHSKGFDLTHPPHRFSSGRDRAFSGAGLVPAREPFVVLVYDHDSDGEHAFKILRSQGSSESFAVRKANVVVMSDAGMTAPMRKRVRAALAQLG